MGRKDIDLNNACEQCPLQAACSLEPLRPPCSVQIVVPFSGLPSVIECMQAIGFWKNELPGDPGTLGVPPTSEAAAAQMMYEYIQRRLQENKPCTK